MLIWLIYSRAATIEFKWRFGLKIGISHSILSLTSNYLNRLEFELDEDSRSEVLDAAKCHVSVWCWMDAWHDFKEVRN